MNYVIQKKPIPKLFDDNGDFLPGVHYSEGWCVFAETPEAAWEKFQIYTTAPKREDYEVTLFWPNPFGEQTDDDGWCGERYGG